MIGRNKTEPIIGHRTGLVDRVQRNGDHTAMSGESRTTPGYISRSWRI